MFRPFWNFILILGLVVFIILGIWLVLYSGRTLVTTNSNQLHLNSILKSNTFDCNKLRSRYQLIWSTDFSSQYEYDGCIDQVRWITASDLHQDPDQYGYY